MVQIPAFHASKEPGIARLCKPEGGCRPPSFLLLFSRPSSACLPVARTVECFDPPALLAGMDTPQTLGMERDPPGIRPEECPLIRLLFISLHFRVPLFRFPGREAPYFWLFFALCAVFSSGVVSLLYPRQTNGTQGQQLVFSFLRYAAAEVYFQLQTQISPVFQCFLRFRSSTAEETEVYRCDTFASPVGQLVFCDFPTASMLFSLCYTCDTF